MNELKLFIRHLIRNKVYAFVTIVGFACSLAFVLLLSLYIQSELSVNKPQNKKHRIYRLANEFYGNSPAGMGEWLMNKYPEIENYTRIYRNDDVIKLADGKKHKMEFLMADSSFLNIFSFNLIEGNTRKALKNKHSIILSQNYAWQLFGEESAIGKTVELKNGIICYVDGVIEDISNSSNFRECDAIVNFTLLTELWSWDGVLNDFGRCAFATYFLARPNTNLPSKESEVLKLFKEEFWVYQQERAEKVIFEPLTDEYFSTIPGPAKEFNSMVLVVVLTAIAILVLLLAIINYTNLTIAQANWRTKELAVKRLVGGTKRLLIWNYFRESLLLCFISFVFALFIYSFIEPVFNQLFNTRLSFFSLKQIKLWMFSFGGVMLLGLITGIVPSLLITNQNALQLVKGDAVVQKRRFQKVLTAFQFVAVVVLLVSSVTIVKQLSFLKNRNLGFKSENVLWVDCNTNLMHEEELRSLLLKTVGVKNVSFVMGSPLDGGNLQSYIYEEQAVTFHEFAVDTAFFNVMGMTVTTTGSHGDKDAIYLNQNAVKQLGLETNPITFKYHDKIHNVAGIVDDFIYYNALNQPIGLALVRPLKKNDFVWNLLIRIEGKNVNATIDKIANVYSDYFQGAPFEPHFIDQTIDSWYQKEKKTSKVVSYFTWLTIIITAMGMFALSQFYITQKTKEIGIRKVNGAKVSEILTMLNRDFIKWVAIAFVIACPIAWYAMDKWLENFAYKTNLSWWIFALAGIVSLGIALLTVSWQSWRAARQNPVEALRYE